MIRLERLGPPHLEEILAGQDEVLAQEIVGRPWDRESLEGFLGRCGRWQEGGPLQEFAALEAGTGRLLGGGGLNRLAPGLDRDQVALTYWLLAGARGRGLGILLARALLARARALPPWHGETVRESVLLIAPENTASQAVATRLGARPTGAHVPHPADGSRGAERWMVDLGPDTPLVSYDHPVPVSIELIRPTSALRDEVADCLADFAGTAVDGSGIADPARPPLADDEWIEFVTERLAEEDPDTELADGWIHCSSRWIREVGTGEVLGFLAVRHRLTPYLLEAGGHIGYSVRPGSRRRGVATAALAQGLELAAGLGIDPVLITCDFDNIASRRVIEAAGGALEDVRDGKRRYWVGQAEAPAQR